MIDFNVLALYTKFSLTHFRRCIVDLLRFSVQTIMPFMKREFYFILSSVYAFGSYSCLIVVAKNPSVILKRRRKVDILHYSLSLVGSIWLLIFKCEVSYGFLCQPKEAIVYT
jgi:hypothetical protein